jgi:hypothetical protein
MKLGLQNYAVFIQFGNGCIKFNNNKINSLPSMSLHKIIEFYIKWFSVCPNITSKFQTTAIFRRPVKENNDSHRIYRYTHNISLHKTAFV